MSSSRKLRRIRRDTKATRRMVARQTNYVAQASFAERAAWDQHRALEYDRWRDEQARRDALPGWYPDPAAAAQCHACGAPRDPAARETPCAYCKALQRYRYFDGDTWVDAVQIGPGQPPPQLAAPLIPVPPPPMRTPAASSTPGLTTSVKVLLFSLATAGLVLFLMVGSVLSR